MKIQIHNALQQPQEIEVTRVVVLDKFDHPIAIAIEVEDDIIIAETADNTHDFQSLLRNLGIHKAMVVHDVQPKSLPEIDSNNSVF